MLTAIELRLLGRREFAALGVKLDVPPTKAATPPPPLPQIDLRPSLEAKVARVYW